MFYGYLACMYVCIMCVPNAHEVQTRVSDHMEKKLLMVVSHQSYLSSPTRDGT